MYDDETIKLTHRISVILSDHLGSANAITRRDLRRSLRIMFGDIETSDREMRATIKRQLPGVCYGGRGYYLPRDKGEADKTLEQNNKRAVALFKANKNFMEAHPEWYGSGVQGRLFN